jgi:hypothetical protein
MTLGTQIPSTIVARIVPLISDQVNLLSKFADKISSDSLNLETDVICSDPRVKKIKSDLQKLQQEINKLNIIINGTTRISNIIDKVASAANVAKLLQLAIPAAPGVPSGPVTVLINTFTKIVDNCSSAIICLNAVLQGTKIILPLINSSIADVLDKLGSICNSEVFETSVEVADIVNQSNLRDLNRYPTEFYNTYNVSEDDIFNRFDAISDLLENQLNVVDNLIEAPSDVIRGTVAPTISLGKVDDYYINTTTYQIYGPKTLNGWGRPVN